MSAAIRPRDNRRVQIRSIDPNTRPGVQRGGVVVCIPVDEASEHLTACLRGVAAHTPREVPIVVCDDRRPESDGLDPIRQLGLDDASANELWYVRPDHPIGPLAAVNAALAIAAPADVVLLSSDCVVAAEWLEGLRQAAYSDSRVATASALSCQALSGDNAAASVRSRSLRLHPLLTRATGPCVYMRRSALELVGDPDAAFVAGPGADSEFSERCVGYGLRHVLADDVLVLDRSPTGRGQWPRPSTDGMGQLARSLTRVRRALGRLSVVIDARTLSEPTTGTQVHVIEVIAALARTEGANLSAIVPDNVSDDAARRLRSLPAVTLLTDAEVSRQRPPRADLVHRPFQVHSYGDLALPLALADRLVITQQDLITYTNPAYFPSLEAWNGYRQLTRTALAVADRVLFFSSQVRNDALADDLVDPTRASLAPIGVDHVVAARDQRGGRPWDAARLPEDAEVILCLGTDYRHKNRPFALRVIEELQRRHGWRGRLVFAGPRIGYGSSAEDEKRILAAAPALAEVVIDLGPVGEAEKAWLLGRAGLVFYPTVHEGFGLVPFEAASHGVPCMWAAGTSLSEVLPESAAEIVAWDAPQTADRALQLLRDARMRERNVRSIRSAGARLTWDATAGRLLELYGATCDAPSPPAGALERRHGPLTGGLSEDAMRLMGPGGALPADVERPLLALAMHPVIGTPLFGALRLGYRASYKLRRWGRGNGARAWAVDRQSSDRPGTRA